MLFDFGQETRSGFWMKDTLIPLDIGFFNADGLLVGKDEMVPCLSDPCEIYRIEDSYWFALEVPTGDLEEAIPGEWRIVLP